MKITCTKLEKKWLVKALVEGDTCYHYACGDCYPTCEECVEKRIEWEIVENDEEEEF